MASDPITSWEIDGETAPLGDWLLAVENSEASEQSEAQALRVKSAQAEKRSWGS